MTARDSKWRWLWGPVLVAALVAALTLFPRLLRPTPATVTIGEGIVSAMKQQLKLTVLDLTVVSDPNRPSVHDYARYQAWVFRLGSYHGAVDWRARARLTYDMTRARVIRHGPRNVELRVPTPEVEVVLPASGVTFRERRVGLFLSADKLRQLEQDHIRRLTDHVRTCLTASTSLYELGSRTLDSRLRALMAPLLEPEGVKLRIVHEPEVATGDRPALLTRRPAQCGSISLALEDVS